MSAPTSVQEILDGFTSKIVAHLDENRLAGPVRVDPTRTIVIIPVAGRDPIHVHIQGGITDQGAQSVVHQIGLVPSLKPLLKS